jgi:hypothetical protein
MGIWNLAALLALLAASPAVAHAAPRPPVPLPPVNLGGSSFLDGLGGPGLLTRVAASAAHAPSIAGPDGGALAGENRVSSFTTLLHLGYVAPWRLLGGYLGAEVLLPIVLVDVDVDVAAASDRGGGPGDLILSPVVFQLPSVALGTARLHHKVNLGVILPTGRYRRDAAVNPGSRVTSVNPFYAFTVAWAQGLELSARLHYLWSSANDAPAPAYEARSIQPGQAAHANAALSYAVTPAVRVGMAGYWLEQLTDARVDGAAVPGGRERVGAIGPGLLATAGRFTAVANAYAELLAKNRPVGARLAVSLLTVW